MAYDRAVGQRRRRSIIASGSAAGLLRSLPVLLLLALAAPARAETAFTLSTTGAGPSVAVEPGGTAHVVWNEPDPANDNDTVRYCRLPRGATACAVTHDLQAPEEDIGSHPRVLLGPGGRVVVVSHRCCANAFGSNPDGFSLEATFAFVSDDGGSSFGAARNVGTVPPSGDAIYGPGDFSVSSITSIVTGGTFFQTTPLDARQTKNANVGEQGKGINNAFGHGTAALLDALTPIAAFDDLETTYFRVFSGSGSTNTLADWGAIQTVGQGDEPRLAGGPRGVWLQYRPGSPGARGYVARRYDPLAGSFGPPVKVTETGEPIFADFDQDASGGLHSAWTQPGGPDRLLYNHASAQGSFGAPRAVVANEPDIFRINLSGAGDGGAVAVWDGNNKAPVRAVHIAPPRPATSGDCPVVLSFGLVEARALDGCFKRSKARYRASGPVRINGLDLTPGAKAQTEITRLSGGRAEIRTTAPAKIRAGLVDLGTQTIAWKVGKATGTAAVGQLPKTDGGTLFNLKVGGDAEVVFTKGGSRIALDVKMPPPFTASTGKTTVATGPAGLDVSKLQVEVPTADVGLLWVKNVKITYVGDPGIFRGSARFELPPLHTPALDVEFGLLDGKFDFARGIYMPSPPGIPLYPPVLYMTQLGFGLVADPLQLEGGVVLAAGAGQVVTVNALPPAGGLKFTFPSGQPATLRVSGTGEIVSIPLAQAFIEYRTDGLLKFGGGVSYDFGIASFSAGIPDGSGFVDLGTGAFNAGADISLCAFFGCGSGSAVFSSKGVGACVSVPTPDPPSPAPAVPDIEGGLGYKWGGSPDVFLGCDLGPYKVKIARAAAAGSVELAGGRERAVIAVEGVGGAPVVTVTAPDGQSASGGGDAPVYSGRLAILPSPSESRTYVHVDRPLAGAYVIDPAPNSVPLGRVLTSEQLPALRVTAAIAGRGHRRALRWRIGGASGRRVTFVERAANAYRVLGRARGTAGSLRFSPAPGPRGRREIVALVEQGDVVREQRTVARYTAPAPLRPARPRALRMRARGPRLDVRWQRVRGVRTYRVQVANRRDGSLRLFRVRRTRLVIAGLERGDRVTVRVAALAADGTPGRAAVRRLRVR